MFHKRKQQNARSAQSTWQEPRVGEPAATESETGKDAGRDAQAGQGGGQSSAHGGGAAAPASKPAPRPDASAVLNRQPTPPVRPDAGRRSAAASAQTPARPEEHSDSKKLIVGRDISLAGEIRTCETLVVEGTVEAELSDTSMVKIESSGLFKGKATVDVAEIAGRFEGELTVRKRLYVRATGNVHGTIKYRGLEIESGGRIGGTLTELGDDDAGDAASDAGASDAPAEAGPAAPARGNGAGEHPHTTGHAADHAVGRGTGSDG